MLVRVVIEHRRGAATLLPGVLVEVPDEEAMGLVEDGLAVPAGRDAIETNQRETR